MIYLLTNDLFFVPAVQSSAMALEQTTVVGRDQADEKLFPADASQARAFIVDLNAISLRDLDDLSLRIRQHHPQARLIAFGSHVHQVRLDRAREAGFDEVLTKGQFSQQLGRLMQSWLSV